MCDNHRSVGPLLPCNTARHVKGNERSAPSLRYRASCKRKSASHDSPRPVSYLSVPRNRRPPAYAALAPQLAPRA